MQKRFSILLMFVLVTLAGRAQVNDARLTPAERATWTHLNQRAAAAVPSHVLWFTDGRGLVGWLHGQTNGVVQWEAPFGADGRWRMQFARAELSHAEQLNLKPAPINYCDVNFQMEFPDLRLIRAPPYTVLTDESPEAAERYLSILQTLQTNFVARFGALTGGFGLPDHVQVLLFTDEDAFQAYEKGKLGKRPVVMGFYMPALQRLTVCDQRYLEGMDEILARLAWQSEKQQVQAATDAAADQVRLVMLSQACDMLRRAEMANQRVLRHEGAHQLFHTSGILVEGATPGWLAEGLAQWCETRVPGAVEFVLADALKGALENDKLIPLADLMGHQSRKDQGFFDGDRRIALAYAESWGLVRLLMRPPYQEKFFAFLKQLRRPEAARDIRRTAQLELLCRFLGMTPEEWDKHWKNSIARLPFDSE